MHTATWLALQDELEKIASEDAPYSKGEKAAIGLGALGNVALIANDVRHMVKGTSGRIPSYLVAAPSTAAILGVGVKRKLQGKKFFGARGGGAAKTAGLGSAALDVAGLGALAAPTIQHMRGKQMSEKNKNRMELAGLGTLGASVAAEHGKDALHAAQAGAGKLVGGAKKLLSKMPKHAGLNDGVLEAKIMRAKFAPDEKPKKQKKKTKHAAPSMSAMMNMHRLADAAKAAKGVAAPMAQAATKLPGAAQQAARATHLGQHMATGGHAWNPAAAAKRAISL